MISGRKSACRTRSRIDPGSERSHRHAAQIFSGRISINFMDGGLRDNNLPVHKVRHLTEILTTHIHNIYHL